MSGDNSQFKDGDIVATFTCVNDVIAMLHDAISGLLFTSESDYPMTIFQLPPTESSSTPQIITIENAESVFLSKSNGPCNIDSIHRQDWTTNIAVEGASLDWFFHRYTKAQEWWEQSQHAALPRWKHLESIINKSLLEVSVFRIGQTNDSGLYASIDVFIIGRCRIDPETWVGLHTISVET